MKLVVAIVKPSKLGDIKAALSEIGVQGITVGEVKGFGRQKGHDAVYRGREYHVEFIPRLRLEIAIEDSLVERVIQTIERAARTGEIGDGKIFLFPLEEAVRIRTGERGEDAL
ncbi:MAG: P-II family nitrogen regulator [Candidatus Sumerlaeia bacterium]|nr:P-II family nitrogen regulator [Candidatus Sumerlaeia bacterium]